MIVTNDYNLPIPVYQSLASSDYDPHGDYSTTGIIGPPRIHFLRKRHDHEIVVDAMDLFFGLRGTALHYVLAQVKHQRAIVEERFLMHFEGFQISIKGDLVWPEDHKENRFTVYDYKQCSTFIGKMDHPKPEWEKQLNLIKFGLFERGIHVQKLAIVAFFTDWNALDAKINSGGNYPQQPIKVIEVGLVDNERIKQWLRGRISLFESCKDLPDDQLPLCSVEERWGTKDRFAVVHVKNGKPTKAVKGGKHFDTELEAETFRSGCPNPEDKMVQFRRGDNKRCERYCEVRHFCDYYNTVVDPSPF